MVIASITLDDNMAADVAYCLAELASLRTMPNASDMVGRLASNVCNMCPQRAGNACAAILADWQTSREEVAAIVVRLRVHAPTLRDVARVRASAIAAALDAMARNLAA
jgi:hypothetical protein